MTTNEQKEKMHLKIRAINEYFLLRFARNMPCLHAAGNLECDSVVAVSFNQNLPRSCVEACMLIAVAELKVVLKLITLGSKFKNALLTRTNQTIKVNS